MRVKTMQMWLVSVVSLALAFSLLIAPRAANAQVASPASSNADLAAAKTALAKYSDPFVAIKDGYFSTVACMDFPMGMKDGTVDYPPGAMGIHFLNTSNIGPKLDPTKPQVLIYAPVGNKLVLAGAEWFVPVAALGPDPVAPAIFGHALAGPMDGHAPIMPASLRHYDLHVWFWKNNPRGMFTSTNADLKCVHGSPYTVSAGAHHSM
jgi:hypothetical protein